MNGQELMVTEEEVDIAAKLQSKKEHEASRPMPEGRPRRPRQCCLHPFTYRDRMCSCGQGVPRKSPKKICEDWGWYLNCRPRTYEDHLSELGQSTLEERRHKLDMQQVHQFLSGKDRVKSDTWLKKGEWWRKSDQGGESAEHVDPSLS